MAYTLVDGKSLILTLGRRNSHQVCHGHYCPLWGNSCVSITMETPYGHGTQLGPGKVPGIPSITANQHGGSHFLIKILAEIVPASLGTGGQSGKIDTIGVYSRVLLQSKDDEVVYFHRSWNTGP